MNTKPVSIYTTTSCVYCKLAKDFFKEKGVAYQEFDVVSDLAKRHEMIEKSGQMGVPVITIGDDLIVGFDRQQISKLLGL
ncbi:NrdH-redoxin [Candidatus Nomurabacteria bacterium RIFCSPLOWO2_02_FULL_42_17]|uniref:NrdH-redoxin n=1 Tax=Candidatus Nomurabacteria bacterium RIFCSPLOWO2_02_FULL_42_17 TaxID=1801789 RepID=A0A1F6XPX3_9BACT|nr:MAG: NrdH-redoxin [Candidatus Nomurabacteria bacterium RIFCSPLOWO2_02_FULL_42_17]